MAVNSPNALIQYVGNGSTSTPYPITFELPVTSWLKAQVMDAQGVTTDLILGTHFNYSPAGVTTVQAYPSTSLLTFYRDVPLTQLLDLVYNDRLPSTQLEAALDKLTYIAQQLSIHSTGLQKSLLFPLSEPLASNRTLPAPEQRKGKLLYFDAADGSPSAQLPSTTALEDNAVITAKLADEAVTTEKLADASVTASKVANSSVTTGKISDGSVSEAKLADSSVTAAKLASGSVSGAKIQDGAVSTAKLADGTISALKLADGAVTTIKIFDASVTAAKLNSQQSGTAPIFGIRAWAKLNPFIVGDNRTAGYRNGTYTRDSAGTVVSMTGHGLKVNDRIFLDFTTGTATDGLYQVTAVNSANQFVIAHTGAATSGNVTAQFIPIQAQGNISSASWIDASNDRFLVNFSTPMPHANYATLASGQHYPAAWISTAGEHTNGETQLNTSNQAYVYSSNTPRFYSVAFVG